MSRLLLWLLTAGALCLPPTASAQPPRADDAEALEQAVPPVDRPNQIAVRELAARLGMELRATADGKVVVAAVHPESQAAALDIRPGDVLLSIERQPVNAQVAAVDIIAADNPQKKIALVFTRDGQPLAVTTAFPDRVARVVPGPAPAVSPYTPSVTFFGLAAVENSEGQVVVVAVAPDSAAALAGVAPDDLLLQVDDQNVTSLQRFAAVAATLTQAKRAGDTVTIEALRRGSDQTFVLVLRQRDLAPAPTAAPVPGAAPSPPEGPPAGPPRPARQPQAAAGEPTPDASPSPIESAFPPSPPEDAAARAAAPPQAKQASSQPAARANEQEIFCMKVRRLASGDLVVTEVIEGSPPAHAGIRPGDAIVSIGGDKVETLQELVRAISLQEEGATVEFGVVRADRLGSLQVKMLPCEYKPEEGKRPAEPRAADGATVESLSAQMRELKTQVEELSKAVELLTQAVEDLQSQ